MVNRGFPESVFPVQVGAVPPIDEVAEWLGIRLQSGVRGFDSRSRLRKERSLTEQGLLDDVGSLVFEDIAGTLKRLEESKERIAERLAAVLVNDAREIVKRYKITEPLREGIEKLVGMLEEFRGRLAAVQGRMSIASDLLAEAKTRGKLARVEAYRQELFEHQAAAAALMMAIEEQEDHLQNVRKRLGEEPTALELDRAVAVIEMHDKLSSQLIEMSRLLSWFGRKKEE